MRLSDMGTGGGMFGGIQAPVQRAIFGSGGVNLSPRPIIGGTTNPTGPILRTRPILGSYKKGTKRVKRTGAYMLHKDEAVLNKKDAQSMRAKVKATMGKKAGC